MDRVDLSIILNVHDEVSYIARTLRATEDASRFARAGGACVELVLVLDRPSSEMTRFIDSYESDAFDGTLTLTVDHGSLGPSRNAGIGAAGGEFVVLCDGDDIPSYNAFDVSLNTIRRSGPQTVVFPEYLCCTSDGGINVVYSDSDILTSLRFLSLNPYCSRMMAPRSLLMAMPLSSVPIGKGYAFEDWHMNCELLAAGVSFRVAPQTILFYRRRPGSLSLRSVAQSTRQIPPSRLFEPEVFRRLALAQADPAGVRPLRSRPEHDIGHVFASEWGQQIVQAANHIDPTISPAWFESLPCLIVEETSDHLGAAYLALCGSVEGGKDFTDVAFASSEMSDDDVGDVVRFLGVAEARSASSRVLVLGQDSHDLDIWLSRRGELPDGSVFIPLRELTPPVIESEVDTLCLKLIQAVCPTGRVHLGGSSFGRRFWTTYGGALAGNRAVVHRFGEQELKFDGRTFRVDDDVHLISDSWDSIDMIVSCRAESMQRDLDRFGRHDKWRWISDDDVRN